MLSTWCVLFLLAAVACAGDYDVISTNASLVGAIAGPNNTVRNLPFGLDVHYPSVVCGAYADDGDDAGVTTFPGVVVLVSFGARRDTYRAFARGLASKGYVVAVAEGVTLINPFVRSVAPVTVTTAVSYLVENAAAFGIQAGNLALVGHSFGASPAFVFGSDAVPAGYCAPQFASVLCAGLDAASNPLALVGHRVKAVLGLGASRDYFDFVSQTLLVNVFPTVVPVGFIWGTEDRIVNASRRDDAYANGVSAPKALFTIDGTGHLGMLSAVAVSPTSPEVVPYTLDQEDSIKRHVYIADVFLSAFVKNDRRNYRRIFNRKDIKGPCGVSVLVADD